jgi:hypothetical protein
MSVPSPILGRFFHNSAVRRMKDGAGLQGLQDYWDYNSKYKEESSSNPVILVIPLPFHRSGEL